MSEMKVTVVGKIIEGAMMGDLEKVKSYGNLLADDLANQGEERASRIIRNALDPNHKKGNICTLDLIE